MDRWVGKVAVVTGASSGIGAAIAKDLADRGVIVVALARRLVRLQVLANKTKGTIHAQKCDLQVESEILAVFRWVEKTLGGVDILVNNSAVMIMSSLMDGDTTKWQQMLDTNVKGLSICTREALKTMRKRGDNGHIFHINSVGGHRVVNYPGMPLGMYVATKHAVTALTEAIRLELQQAESKIKITGISPGGVFTELATGAMEGKEEVGGMNIDTLLKAEDISEALIYALGTRPNVQVHDIHIQPLGQTF